MAVFWTDEAVDDLVEILAYYHREAGPATADAVERRIVAQVEALARFPESCRTSERIPGARELVIRRLPYIVFVKPVADGIVVLDVVHAARRFPFSPEPTG